MTTAAYLEWCRQELETALSRYLPSPPATPEMLADAMRYSVNAGGKRLRPTLTLATAEAIAGASGRELAMPAACAIEMIHTYSLVHDDLPAMDDDILRRGRPTLHVVAGEGMAILAGDGLQALAFHVLASDPASDNPAIAQRKLQTLQVVAEAAGPSGMVGGQAIDLDAVRPGPDRPAVTFDSTRLETMHALKTGRMIRAAVGAGALMARAPAAPPPLIDGYGTHIGLAFQIVDDILDVEGASAALGKTSGKDAAMGKPTYPALFGLEASRRLATECVARADACLHDAGLAHTHLPGIARWIVQRQS